MNPPSFAQYSSLPADHQQQQHHNGNNNSYKDNRFNNQTPMDQQNNPITGNPHNGDSLRQISITDESNELVTLSAVKPVVVQPNVVQPNKEGLKLGNQIAQLVSPINNLYESGSSSQSSRQGSLDRSRNSSNEGASRQGTPELQHMLNALSSGWLFVII